MSKQAERIKHKKQKIKSKVITLNRGAHIEKRLLERFPKLELSKITNIIENGGSVLLDEERQLYYLTYKDIQVFFYMKHNEIATFITKEMAMNDLPEVFEDGSPISYYHRVLEKIEKKAEMKRLRKKRKVDMKKERMNKKKQRRFDLDMKQNIAYVLIMR